MDEEAAPALREDNDDDEAASAIGEAIDDGDDDEVARAHGEDKVEEAA